MLVQSRPTADLVPHPKVKHLLGRWSADSDAMVELRRSIQEHGLLQPLVITTGGEIVDGLTRWQAARALQMAEVPCHVAPELDAIEALIDSEVHRRHSTKSQLAFRLAPFVAGAFFDRYKLNEERKACGNANDFRAKSFRAGEKTVSDYARELGVSVRLLEQAHELHGLFAEHPEERSWTSDDALLNLKRLGVKKGTRLSFAAYYTPLLLDPHRPMPLHSALVGVKSILTEEGLLARHGGRHKGRADLTESKQLKLFTTALKDLGVRYEYWQKFNADAREVAKEQIANTIAAMPDDLLAVWEARIRAERKNREAQ